MKIIHTADWHLGRVLHQQSLLEDQVHVLDQLFDYIQVHNVDALVVAGDIYDRTVPPKEAVTLLDGFINRLAEIDVPIVMISGNHDGAERLGFASKQLKEAGVHIMGDLSQIHQPVVVEKSGVKLNIYGIPYADPEKVRDVFEVEVKDFDSAHTYLVEHIKSAYNPKEINLLMSHCFVDGADSSDSEKTLSIGGSDRVSYEPMLDFDYVALGHLHSPQKRGVDYIRYSGSILKYSFSEHKQKKGVTLLEFDSSGLVRQEHLGLKPLKEIRIIEGLLDTLIEQGQSDPSKEDYIMARLTDDMALLDPIGKLRAVYPNVLQLEKTMLTKALDKQPNREAMRRGESEMVQDFFKQVTGNDMSAAQAKILQTTLQNLIKATEG
jgi:exonuclease SbcD